MGRSPSRPGWMEMLLRGGLRLPPARSWAPGVAVAVALFAWCLWRWWPSGGWERFALSTDAGAAERASIPASASAEATGPTELWVHVAGAVQHPGLYRLPIGARVGDAVASAGGLSADARPASVNLARVLSDGEQVLVADSSEPPGVSTSGGKAASGGLVDLNTADEATLDTLPGVGPSTALRIVQDREKNGPFRAVEDLQRVSGIGPKRFEQLKDLVTVR